MKNTMMLALCFLPVFALSQDDRFSGQEFSVNGFRAPSIGMEYRIASVSLHFGYYITAFDPGITTKFAKIGLSVWFLPSGKEPIPSSFYASVSFLRGLNLEYDRDNAFSFETGYRWMVWKGLNFRLGAIALASPDHTIKFNPTPAVGYSLKLD